MGYPNDTGNTSPEREAFTAVNETAELSDELLEAVTGGEETVQEPNKASDKEDTPRIPFQMRPKM